MSFVPNPTAVSSSSPRLPAANMRRRLAALVYEGVVLFGVLMVTALVYSPLAGQRHAMEGRHGLQAVVFLVLGAYFIGFWSYGGQTIAAKTWQVRVVTRDDRPLTLQRACARYLLAWLWFLPALAAGDLAGWHDSARIYLALGTGMVAYVLLALMLPDRQFLHDQLCGTRLVRILTPAKG
ncbi:MAG: hypothetical protein RL722_717 [Pseudomonadota bacterium]|jgi:uncharacterized RDD family membrane protein YckC